MSDRKLALWHPARADELTLLVFLSVMTGVLASTTALLWVVLS